MKECRCVRHFGDDFNVWGVRDRVIEEMNTMVFSTERYHSKEDMWGSIVSFISILMKNDYICTVRADDETVIIVEYEHDNQIDDWGTTNPKWLTPNEVELVEEYRKDVVESIKEDIVAEVNDGLYGE